MVASLAPLARDDDGFTELLVAGGELTWRAGPLSKGPGVCHGTAGNGFAFLKLLERTGDERWLDRARAFAVHAAEQVERERAPTTAAVATRCGPATPASRSTSPAASPRPLRCRRSTTSSVLIRYFAGSLRAPRRP